MGGGGCENGKGMQPPLFRYGDVQASGRAEEERRYDRPGDARKLLVSLLGLASVKGIGFRTLAAVYDAGLLLQLRELSGKDAGELLASVPAHSRGQLAEALEGDRQAILDRGEEEARSLVEGGVGFVSSADPGYPPRLGRLASPPRWLFVRGDASVLSTPSAVAVVGTRDPSEHGRKAARRCARALVAYNFVVLSGLARGIDEEAHYGAVDGLGQTIAVLGYGIKGVRASMNEGLVASILENEGALVSEYLPEDYPSRDRFLRRNEIQAALAGLVVPVEMPSLQSGTAATVRRAANLGTPVAGVIPSSTREEGLLRTKANLEELGYPVFALWDKTSDGFRRHLETLFPEHQWQPDLETRRRRFFRSIQHQVEEARDALHLDEETVGRLAESLKRLVSGG